MGGTPKMMVYFIENSTLMDDDWGYPHFRKPPYVFLAVPHFLGQLGLSTFEIAQMSMIGCTNRDEMFLHSRQTIFSV